VCLSLSLSLSLSDAAEAAAAQRRAAQALAAKLAKEAKVKKAEAVNIQYIDKPQRVRSTAHSRCHRTQHSTQPLSANTAHPNITTHQM
jgi:hypothetical protein